MIQHQAVAAAILLCLCSPPLSSQVTAKVTASCPGCRADDVAKTERVVLKVNSVLASSCFREYMEKRRLVEMETRFFRPEANPDTDSICDDDKVIITKKEPAEILTDLVTKDVALQVELYSSGFGGLGAPFRRACAKEGKEGSPQMPVYDRCWRSHEDDYLAATFAHEASHKLGYKHCSNNNFVDSNKTVPYSINFAFQSCWTTVFPNLPGNKSPGDHLQSFSPLISGLNKTAVLHPTNWGREGGGGGQAITLS